MTTSIEIIQASYAAFARGDVLAALAAFAPDIEWTHPDGMSDYGLGGTKKGHEEVLAFMARARTVFSELRPVPTEFVGSGERVVVLGTHHMRGARSGVAGMVPFVHCWRLADGKATHFTDVHDTAEVRHIVEGSPVLAPEPTVARLFAIHDGYIHARALQLAAELGLADRIASGPCDVTDLATATATEPGALYRLLRTLAAGGVFTEVEPGRFGLTEIGDHLRADHPQSVQAIMTMGGMFGLVFADAMYSVRTGEPAFQRTFGAPLFIYLRDNPTVAGLFDAAMAEFSRLETAAIVASYEFSQARRIVDLGGGDGTLLNAILLAHAGIAGTIFDQPHVIDRARPRIAGAGLGDRCEAIPGDFFQEVPPGGDLYILKWIVHDWPDDDAVTILRNCRKVMSPSSRLLLIERLVPSGDTPHSSKIMDFTMLVVLGGRERTRDEYATLLARAGLRLTRTTPTPTQVSIIEAVPQAT